MPLGRAGQVIDLDKFIDRLHDLSYTARTTVLTTAVRDGGGLIQDEISRTAPRGTGKLRANIGLSIIRPTDTQAVARIGPAKSAFYGKFPEIGTKFQDPSAYINPAFERKRDEAFAVALYTLDRGLERRAA